MATITPCSILTFTFECFYLSGNEPKFFGFAEYIAGLAIMALMWTIVDIRYKFRVATATFPINSISIWILCILGILTLFTDYWRANQGIVLLGNFISPATWQYIMGMIFIQNIFLWIWYSLVRPSRFNKMNSIVFINELNKNINQGTQESLSIIANELAYSADNIIKAISQESKNKEMAEQAKIIIDLISNPKFCKSCVSRSTLLITELFTSMSKYNTYPKEMNIFTKNILSAAIEDKSSFLYSESEYYETGFDGVYKEVTNAMTGDMELIKKITTLLSPTFSRNQYWEVSQWKAYFRLVKAVFNTHSNSNESNLPFALSSIKYRISDIYKDLDQKIELPELKLSDELYQKLETFGDLIHDMVISLESNYRKTNNINQNNIKYVENLIFDLFESSANIRKSKKAAKKIQRKLSS